MLTFDEMMGVQLASGVSKNDAGKQFSIGMYNRKTLWKKLLFSRDYSKAILILFYCFIGHPN